MAAAKSEVFKADIESSITMLCVEYIQSVVALVRCGGHVEPRFERLLDVSAR